MNTRWGHCRFNASTTADVNSSHPWPWWEPAFLASTVNTALRSRTPFHEKKGTGNQPNKRQQTKEMGEQADPKGLGSETTDTNKIK